MEIRVARNASTILSCTPSGRVCLDSVNRKKTSYLNNITKIIISYLLLISVRVRFECPREHLNAVYECLVRIAINSDFFHIRILAYRSIVNCLFYNLMLI